MSEKKASYQRNDKDGRKSGEDHEKRGSVRPMPRGSIKRKSVKLIRFQLPMSLSFSEDSSSSSSLSSDVSDSDAEEREFCDRDEDRELNSHSKAAPSPKVLQKVVTPICSRPRKLSKKHCITKSSDNLILPVSSSGQLPKVSSGTPSSSDADFHLIKAIYLRKLDGVKEAIKNGANVNGVADSQAPLMVATELGDDRLVAFLLTVPYINPDTTDYFGQTPLIIAVRNAFDNIVRLLLNHNADVNIADHMGETPLHGVLFQKRPSMAKLLLAYGADVEQCDCFGERPIYTSAVKRPNLECLITLLKMGAAVNYINISGTPLLSRTIMNGPQLSIIEALVKYGASVNAPDLISKKTPLHFAALQNNVRIIQFLLNKGADPKLKTIYNFTPLDEAVIQKSKEAAEVLRNQVKFQRKTNVVNVSKADS